MAKAGCELYRDHFDGLIRKPNGKLRRLTSTCCVLFIFIFFFFSEGEKASRQKPITKRLTQLSIDLMSLIIVS